MNRSWPAGLLLPLILLLAVSCAPPEIAAVAPSPTAAATPTPAAPASVITDVQYLDISFNGATVIWWTSVPTTGRVEYGRTGAYDQATPWSEKLSTVGGYVLDPWGPYQPLWVRVRVKDAAGQETVSKGEMLFSWPKNEA